MSAWGKSGASTRALAQLNAATSSTYDTGLLDQNRPGDGWSTPRDAWTTPGTGDWHGPQSHVPQPPEGCVICGATPTAAVGVWRVIGFVYGLSWQAQKGPFCRTCGTAVVRTQTNTTLMTGWWGPFAFVGNLICLAANARAARVYSALPQPLPPAEPEKWAAPLDPGKPLARRLGTYIGGLVLAGVVAFFGLGLDGLADRDDTGAIRSAGEVASNNLAVGDCFNMPAGPHTSVVGMPCSEPHDAELVAVVEHVAVAGAPYPSPAELLATAQRGCASAFAGYVGRPAHTSQLGLATLSPLAGSWANGDRRIDCAVGMEGTKLSMSVRGSGL